MKRNITLTLRVTPERAIGIVNRLYGAGDFSRGQWVAFLKKIKSDAKKIKTPEIIPEKPRVFYKSYKKHRQKTDGIVTRKEKNESMLHIRKIKYIRMLGCI